MPIIPGEKPEIAGTPGGAAGVSFFLQLVIRVTQNRDTINKNRLFMVVVADLVW